MAEQYAFCASKDTRHLGSFFGQHLGNARARREHLSQAKGVIQKDTDLQSSMWFDYRGIHPTILTHYFADKYLEVYRHFYAKCFDVKRAPYIRPWSGDRNPFRKSKAYRTHLWRLRQQYDEHGAMYVPALMGAFGFIVSKGFKRLPQPQQLRGEDCMQYAMMHWEETERVRFMIAKSSDYVIHDETKMTENQKSHERYLIGRVGRVSATVRDTVIRRLISKKLITQRATNSRLESVAVDLAR